MAKNILDLKIPEDISALIEKSRMQISYDPSLKFLEKAHILSQTKPFWHFYVHWEMFCLAFKYKQSKELLGQIPRMILAIPSSYLGLAPKGNIGSTKMGIFEKKK